MNKEAAAGALKLYRAHHWYKDQDMMQGMAEGVYGDRPEWVGLLREFFSRMPSCPHVEDLPYTPGSHSGMPTLSAVFRYWRSHSAEAAHWFGLHSRVVRNAIVNGGWVCFGCDMPARGQSVWESAGPGSFERAHLQDCCLGGPNEPSNLVPLCSLCHWQMTANFSGCRDCALSWVVWLNQAMDELSKDTQGTGS